MIIFQVLKSLTLKQLHLRAGVYITKGGSSLEDIHSAALNCSREKWQKKKCKE